MLNFNQATLCECCECNPSSHNPTSEETCTNVLKHCILRYCNFDTVLKREPSVDCIRVSKKGHLILVEIKNQPTSNIKKELVEQKIVSTTQYLLENDPQLASLKKVFVLSIPQQKQPRKTNHRQSSNYIKIGNFLADKKVSIFSNRQYNYVVNNQPYKVFSKIALCSETDEVCK